MVRKSALLLSAVLCSVCAYPAPHFAGVLEAGGEHGAGIPASCRLIFQPNASAIGLTKGMAAPTVNMLLLKPDVAGEYVVACPPPSAGMQLYIAVDFPLAGGRASQVKLLGDVFPPADFSSGGQQRYAVLSLHAYSGSPSVQRGMMHLPVSLFSIYSHPLLLSPPFC